MLIRYLSRMLEHPVNPALYFWTAVGSMADKVLYDRREPDNRPARVGQLA
ncbi:MAG: hypothetical protein MZV63_14970 [Marinilabiliales bacterium]|nr:hypothetical protein [Marinilabiliales bacterium]